MLPGRNFVYYFSRFRNASFREIAYRCRQILLVKRLRRRFNSKQPILSVPDLERSLLESLDVPDFTIEINDDLLKSISDGMIFSLSGDEREIARFEASSRGKFFYDIHNPESLDIRKVWESARLQHIAILLIASEQGGSGIDSDHLKYCAKEKLLDWIENNPFLAGPHYMSAMECGLRIPVFFYGLKILDNLTPAESDVFSRAIYEHAWWISRRLSLYSSLGNHTVCECIGLLFAGAIFSNTREGKSWLSEGRKLLERECHHQILEDGGPAEQSFSYHRFVLDLYWLATSFLQKNALYDCSAWKKRIAKGEYFLASFTNSSGRILSVGDSDNGHAVGPCVHPVKRVKNSEKSRRVLFENSGYTVIRFGDDAELTFDHGPLGMPPLYNHGHADALSITLSVRGRRILVDPGTYRYNGVHQWRKYFKGTRAHNTVSIDGLDQAVQATGFIWTRPYKAALKRIEESGNNIILEAVHDGYMRLSNRTEHTRRIHLFGESQILIVDSFSGRGVHDFELNYHLHPECALNKQDGWWVVLRENVIVYVRMIEDADFILNFGQEDPPFCWYSPEYGIKEKSAALSCRKRGRASEVSFTTAISVDKHIPINSYLEQIFLLG
ncbi:MAG: Heparin-sulfate lyase precursor [Smithella sp. PtaU1.Bin162]|nr:MAG: Heparin-sulfate lyase precursor [Smithella sp. PtaU1.Bin162]